MLFGNVLDLDRGIFLKHPDRLMYKSLSGYISKLLSMQDNLLKASAAELLRTDTLRLTTKELHERTVSLPDPHVHLIARVHRQHVCARFGVVL